MLEVLRDREYDAEYQARAQSLFSEVKALVDYERNREKEKYAERCPYARESKSIDTLHADGLGNKR